MSQQSPPPGWYVFDDGSNRQRWWDGANWGQFDDEYEQEQSAQPSRPSSQATEGSSTQAVVGSVSEPAGERQDIKRAVARMSHTFGSKREIKRLEGVLHPGEEVLSMIGGGYAGKTGILVLTNSRLLFFSDGWTGSSHEDFPLNVVSSVGYSGGMLMASLTIHASGNVSEITNVPKSDGKRFTDEARKALTAARSAGSTAASPEPAAAQPAPDPIEQLEKLGALRDSGVLTDAEFEAKKAQILERM